MPDSTNHKNKCTNFTYDMCLAVGIWVGELADTAPLWYHVSAFAPHLTSPCSHMHTSTHSLVCTFISLDVKHVNKANPSVLLAVQINYFSSVSLLKPTIN